MANYIDNREVKGRPIPAFELVEFSAAQSPASVATITTAARAMTFTGILTTDVPIALIKPTEQAGLAIAGIRISAANTLQAVFVNPTAGAIVPTASEVYVLVVKRALTVGPGPGLS